MSDSGYTLIIIIAVIVALLFGVGRSRFTPKKAAPVAHIRFDLERNQVRDVPSVDAQMVRKYGSESAFQN